MSDDVSVKVSRIIAEQAMVDAADVTPDKTPEALGLDSLAIVEIVFAIEEAFDITIPYNANDPKDSDFDISTVGGVISGVKTLLAEKG